MNFSVIDEVENVGRKLALASTGIDPSEVRRSHRGAFGHSWRRKGWQNKGSIDKAGSLGSMGQETSLGPPACPLSFPPLEKDV